MREIKFRAWSTEMGRFVVPDDMTDPYHIPVDPEGDGFKLRSLFILMQYTGLKDKNGKEIYEGDFMADIMHGFDDGKQHLGTTFRVDWSDCSEVMRDYVRHRLGYDFSYHDPGDSVVIGNIYENPELLP